MKKHSLTLFGVPTLFTVLIVVLIISFATLSYLNTLNVRHSIECGNRILEASYSIQEEMELEIIRLEKGLNENSLSTDEYYEWEYDRANQVFSVSQVMGNLSLNVKLNVITLDRIKLEVVEWKLTSGNNQNYTQDGDPVYGG